MVSCEVEIGINKVMKSSDGNVSFKFSWVIMKWFFEYWGKGDYS
jgi:hypothetical protein